MTNGVPATDCVPATDWVLGVGRSLSGRRWVWRAGEDRVGLGIAQRMGVPEIVGRLLAARGIAIDAACDYLDPTLRALLPDPSMLIDMEQGRRTEGEHTIGDMVERADRANISVPILNAARCNLEAYEINRTRPR